MNPETLVAEQLVPDSDDQDALPVGGRAGAVRRERQTAVIVLSNFPLGVTR